MQFTEPCMQGSGEEEKPDEKEEVPEKATPEKVEGEEEGEEKMDTSEPVPEPEVDAVELTSNEFENDLLGAAVPVAKEGTEGIPGF